MSKTYVVIDAEYYFPVEDCWLVILSDKGAEQLEDNDGYFDDNIDTIQDIHLRKALKPEYDI